MRIDQSLFLALYFIITIFLFIHFNSKMDERIDSLKAAINDKIEASNKLSEDIPILDIKIIKRDKANVIIEAKELEKINSHVKFLAEEVQKQYLVSQNLIDSDLNRLNLFITIGIGFLGLIGVFVPILINLMSSNHFTERLGQLEARTKESVNKIDGLNLRTESTLPLIEALQIQSAFSRFINMSPLLITKLKTIDGKDHYIEILSSIKANFEVCMSKGLLLNDNRIRTSINDFKLSIDNGHFITAVHSRKAFASFFIISNHLKTILEDKVDDVIKIGLCKKVIQELSDIVSELKKIKSPKPQ